LPTPSAALGMAMIAAAGVITAIREGYNQRKRKKDADQTSSISPL